MTGDGLPASDIAEWGLAHVWQVLGSIGRFDRFLSSLGADDPRSWAAVTQEHVIRYLDEARNYALEDAKPFFAWLSWRKSVEPVVIPSPPLTA